MAFGTKLAELLPYLPDGRQDLRQPQVSYQQWFRAHVSFFCLDKKND